MCSIGTVLDFATKFGMDGMEKFLDQKHADQDQAKAARRGWCAQIPGLKETAERIIHFWNEAEGIKGIYVRATEDTLIIRFEQRAVGTGDCVQPRKDRGTGAGFDCLYSKRLSSPPTCRSASGFPS